MPSASTLKTWPKDFVSPFVVVPQSSRHDCILASIGTLTGKSLDEVWTAAYKLGVPKIGVYYITERVMAALFEQLGGLKATPWQEFTSFDALPDAALLWVDTMPNDPDNTGRTVVFLHVREVREKWTSFSYVLDVMHEEPEQSLVLDFKRFQPTAFVGLSKSPTSSRAK
jgi:hypothetical protein